MAFQINQEDVRAASDERVPGNARPHFYALIWSEERPESGTLRVDLSSYSGTFSFRIEQPDMEESPEQVAVPPSELAEGLDALRRVAEAAPA